jgi:hypothetical protein
VDTWDGFGKCLGIVWEMFGKCLGIVWNFLTLIIKHLSMFRGNCLGIVWELFGNLVGIWWEFRGKLVRQKKERTRRNALNPNQNNVYQLSPLIDKIIYSA